MYLICTHKNPDLDGIASLLSMTIIHRNRGDECISLAQNIPEYMNFMNGLDLLSKEEALLKIDSYTLVCLDCSSKERVWPPNLYNKADKIINIDHHADNTFFGDENRVNPLVSSTSELLFTLFEENKIDLPLSVCENLYAGILYDSGGFRYKNTNINTLSTAVKLISRGLNPNTISENVFNLWNSRSFKLLSSVLSNSEYFKNESILYTYISFEEVEKNKYIDADFEGVIDILRLNRNSRIILFLRETKKNYFKGSIRSKFDINISDIAHKYGGGGHESASGFEIESNNYKELKEKIIKDLENIL